MNPEQFAKLVEQYQGLLYSICFQMVQDHYIAEDLVQETFLSAYNHLYHCSLENIRPWLAKIALNKAKDYLKSAYNRKVMATEKEYMTEAVCLHIPTPDNPVDWTVQKEQQQEIYSMIQALKEPYYTVADLYFLKEKKADEIAQILERSPKTIHTQIYRAKILLQQKIKERSL